MNAGRRRRAAGARATGRAAGAALLGSVLVASGCKHASADPLAASAAAAVAPAASSGAAGGRSASGNDGRTSHPPMLPAHDDTVPGATVRVTYTPTTVIVDRATLEQALREVSDDGAVYTFASAAGGVLDALHAGSVMLLQTYALRTVTAVHRDGPVLRVETTATALTDAISDGSTKWDHDVTLSRGGALSTRGERAVSSGGKVSVGLSHAVHAPNVLHRIGDFLVPPLHAAVGQAATTTGQIADYGYTLTFTPSDDRINIVVEVTQKVPCLELNLTGTGYLQNFANGGDIEISGGSLTTADFSSKRLNGEMTLD